MAADAVQEPKVIAQLPAEWLSLGVLKGSQSVPFDASNVASRDTPSAIDAIVDWPGTQEAERAHKNNFYTAINEDSPGTATCAYKTSNEPWLYDRASTMFGLYFRSGSAKALREAIRFSDFYRSRLNASGAFALGGDTKYSFNESLAYAFWATGDATFLPAIAATAAAHDATAHAWTTTRRFWTERAIAFKLMAHAVDYEVNGSAARRDSVNSIVQELVAHQNGASLPIPTAGRVDGGWYHTGQQHDPSEMPSTLYGASPWMTALLSDALRRSYLTSEDLATAHMIRRTGNFLRASLRFENSQYGGYSWAPRYLVEWDGTDFAPQAQPPNVVPMHEDEHALDVGAALAWSYYFGALTGQRDALDEVAALNVYDTYARGVNEWISPGSRPAFRVLPCRKWSWEHRTSDGLSWALTAAVDSSRVFADSFE